MRKLRLDGTPHGAVEARAVQVADMDRVVEKLDHGGRRRAGRDYWWCGMSRGATGERGTGFLVHGVGTHFAIARDYRKDRGRVKGAGSGKSSVGATGTLVGGGGSDAQDGESRFGADTVRGYDSLV